MKVTSVVPPETSATPRDILQANLSFKQTFLSIKPRVTPRWVSDTNYECIAHKATRERERESPHRCPPPPGAANHHTHPTAYTLRAHRCGDTGMAPPWDICVGSWGMEWPEGMRRGTWAHDLQQQPFHPPPAPTTCTPPPGYPVLPAVLWARHMGAAAAGGCLDDLLHKHRFQFRSQITGGDGCGWRATETAPPSLIALKPPLLDASFLGYCTVGAALACGSLPHRCRIPWRIP